LGYRPKSRIGRRTYTLILTLLDTGLSIEEALTLPVAGVDWDAMALRVMGKGSKERLVPFSLTLRPHLWRLAHARKGLVFASYSGAKLTRRNIYKEMTNLCRAARAIAPAMIAAVKLKCAPIFV
jgi:integrase/recombinase XerD